jgi:preprotein translocase subunit SecA
MSVIKFINKMLGDPKAKNLQRIRKIVEKVNTREEEMQEFSEEKFQEITENFSGKSYRESEETLIDMLALTKNACRRIYGSTFMVGKNKEQWKMIPYDVQLVGAIALLEGKISEMRTGEGKTLVAGLAASVAAFEGKGIHVVTVNDYLAERDSLWNAPLFEKLGLTVGVIIHGKTPEERKKAYAESITYGTNNEFGFDYLRDNMAISKDRMVQKPLHFALIDEVDSILIDEARTPLIISAPAGESTEKYVEYASLVQNLEKDTHYTIDEKQKSAILTEEGVAKMESLLGVENIYTEKGFKEVHHIEQALRATACFQKDTDYVVSPEHGVVIVDEFTGRLMPGRRYSDGLHQALEAKERVEVRQQSKTLASITFQNYFRLYDVLAGMTGTAETEEEEFGNIYNLQVLSIPTNRPIQRIDKKDVVFKTERGKFSAIAQIVKEKNLNGQPVLIGTASIEKSESLSAVLKREGIAHHVLNAKHHKQEAEIITNAGQKGSVTIATNMAGRGTDIRLGEGVEELGGLAIVGSERHESRRIDNQFRGRAGRQGDKGETQFFVSLEDSLMRMFGSDKLLGLMNQMNIPEDLPIENGFISKGIENAQKKVEGLNFDRRKHVLQYDNVMNRHREIIYERRKKLLENEDIHGEVLEMLRDEAENIVDMHVANRESHKWDIEGLQKDVLAFHKDETNFPIETLKKSESIDELKALTIEYLNNAYAQKQESFPDKESAEQAERMVNLRIIDTLFMEHISTMSRLKEQVSLRAYGQRDPLMEYKADGFHTFKKLLAEIRKGTISTLFHMDVDSMFPKAEPVEMRTNEQEIVEKGLESGVAEENVMLSNQANARVRVIKAQEVLKKQFSGVGRNDPCPCGSGKKFKKCCGA